MKELEEKIEIKIHKLEEICNNQYSDEKNIYYINVLNVIISGCKDQI